MPPRKEFRLARARAPSGILGWEVSPVTAREELHRLVDALPEQREETARLFLRFLMSEGDFDPEPLSPDEAAEAERAWAAHATGQDPGESLGAVRSELMDRRRG